MMSGRSNLVFVCGQCGTEFIASYQPAKSPRCVLCRKNPEIKHRVMVKPKRRRNYVPMSLKVRQK